MARSNQEERLKLFISYARRDMAKTDRLVAALEQAGFEVLIDRRDLPYGEEWQKELSDLIRASDTVVWLVSPYSVKSRWCNWELAEVQRLNKRPVPVIIELVQRTDLPETLGKFQVLPREGSFDFDSHMPALVETLNIHRAWLKEHTRLADRARQWLARERSSALLLRGVGLKDAQAWADRKPRAAPAPSGEVLSLLLASRRAQNRRERGAIVGSMAVALLALGLAGLAYWQRNYAVEQRNLAEQNEARAVEQQQLAEAQTRIAIRNESVALASMSKAATLSKDYAAAAILALAAWPRGGEEQRPFRQEAIDALSVSLPYILETGRIVADTKTQEAIYLDEGNAIAVRSGQKPIQIWDLTSWTLRQSIGPEGLNFWAMEPSPDGKLLAAGTIAGELMLYEISTGKLLASTKAHDDGVMDIAFAPDGATLATGASASRDSRDVARVWSAPSLEPVAVLEGHKESVHKLRYSPDGTTIATKSIDGVLISDARTGAILWSDPKAESRLIDIAESAEFIGAGRKVIAVWMDGPAEVIDIDLRLSTELPVCGGDPVRAFVSPDLSRVYIVCPENKGVLLDSKTLEKIAEVTAPGAASDAVFSDDNLLFATSNLAGAVEVFDATTGEHLLGLTGHTDGVLSLAFTPDKKLISASSDGTVRVWNATARAPSRVLGNFGELAAKPALSPDGRELGVISTGPIDVYDFEDGTTHTLAPDEAFTSVRFSPDRTRIVALNFVGEFFLLTNPAGEIIDYDKIDAEIADFSPKGDSIAIALEDGTVRLVDVETDKTINDFVLSESADDIAFSPDGALAFSPDGMHLAAGTGGEVKVWNIADKSLVMSFRNGNSEETNSLAFSPDGTRLAVTGGVGDATELWQVGRAATSPEMLLADSQFYPGMVAFSPDGSRVVRATGSFASVWDAATGAAIAFYPQPNPDGYLEFASFTPDGGSLVTVSQLGEARLWDLSNAGRGDAFHVACQKLSTANSLEAIAGKFGLSGLTPICAAGYEPMPFQRAKLDH